MGIALLSRSALLSHRTDEIVTPATDWDPLRLTVSMIARADMQPGPAVRKLIEVLRKVSAERSQAALRHVTAPSARSPQ